MMGVTIFIISFLILLEFFLSYTRSLIVASRGQELSERARELCGFEAKALAGGQFQRLVLLIALCPETGDDSLEVRAVSLYFHLLGFARTISTWVVPSAGSWIEAERGGCACVAAGVLDRRIAYNLTLMERLDGR